MLPTTAKKKIALTDRSHETATPVRFLLVCLLLMPGCSTPDLKPFTEATTTLSTTVKAGGDLAIRPIATIPIWTDDLFVSPRDPNHPYKALEAAWEKRRNTMDAVLVYSASLQAISDAAAHRSENAAVLVNSVAELASSVPAYGVAFESAGNLVIKGIETTIEVKAFHDMRRAVASADAAIQMVAGTLKKDLGELANLLEAPLNDQIAKLGASLRPVARLERALRDQRDAQRGLVAADATNVATGVELARLDSLHQSAVTDLTRIQEQRADAEDAIRQGKQFFANACAGVDAWAGAHSDLVKAFEEKRMPNFALLIARADELRQMVNDLKSK